MPRGRAAPMRRTCRMRILLVEDEAELLHDIAKGLTLKGYAVDGADKCTSCGACGKA